MKAKLVLSAIIALSSNLLVAQNGVHAKWDKQGDAPGASDSKLGTTNNQGFSIITNNQPAITFSNNGTANFTKPVNFTNRVKFDSIRVLKYLDVDSIHARTIKIGNSWTVNDAGFSYGGTRPYNQQLQNAVANENTKHLA
ncbi:MAG: hypothetical protein IM600_18305 [Bacteroidetes bacterium]|nr:hypothetical protein [Bacteroidota bacterium]MCA6445385.1 hypothetical protein [Bacteroidota bacterium]